MLRSRTLLVAFGALSCTPLRGMPMPSFADGGCPPLESATQPPPLADVPLQPIPATLVTVLPFDGTPPPGGDLRPAIVDALAQRGFTTVTEPEPEITAELVVAGSYARGRPPTVTFTIHDVARGVTAALTFALADGDLIAPIVVPTALAEALADHVAAPIPLTDEERWILDQLDEPPYRAPTEFCELGSW